MLCAKPKDPSRKNNELKLVYVAVVEKEEF